MAELAGCRRRGEKHAADPIANRPAIGENARRNPRKESFGHSEKLEGTMSSTIVDIHGRQILDSRGNPTVEVDVRLADGSFGRAPMAESFSWLHGEASAI